MLFGRIQHRFFWNTYNRWEGGFCSVPLPSAQTDGTAARRLGGLLGCACAPKTNAGRPTLFGKIFGCSAGARRRGSDPTAFAILNDFNICSWWPSERCYPGHVARLAFAALFFWFGLYGLIFVADLGLRRRCRTAIGQGAAACRDGDDGASFVTLLAMLTGLGVTILTARRAWGSTCAGRDARQPDYAVPFATIEHYEALEEASNANGSNRGLKAGKRLGPRRARSHPRAKTARAKGLIEAREM
jgi:hypothetical protein